MLIDAIQHTWVRHGRFTSPFKHKYGDSVSRAESPVDTAERGTSAGEETKQESEAVLTRRVAERKEDAKVFEMTKNLACVVER